MAERRRLGDVAGLFRDRAEGGARLARLLEAYRGQDVLVLAIPRGGVPVAAEVARHLDAELDVMVARKLGAPGAPELAIGAVTANGGRYLNTGLIRDLGVSDAYLDVVTAEQMEEARRREERLRGAFPRARVQGRVVILVDDGLATGATMRAAVRAVQRQQPARVIVAVPVGAHETCEALRNEVDDVVCVYELDPFWAVGLYYEHFEPTEDAVVEEILRESRARRARAAERSR